VYYISSHSINICDRKEGREKRRKGKRGRKRREGGKKELK
jgi:hypothetical protein